jgi:hypothetical protein
MHPKKAWFVWIGVCGLAVGCVADDTGHACSGISGLPTSPVADPSLPQLAVGVTRDTRCISLQCLTAQGVAPYCSRPCTPGSCAAGFSCQVAQDVGPYANQKFCMRQTCSRVSDCGQAKHMACTALGCDDICRTDPKCPAHLIRCVPGSTQGTPTALCQPSGQVL